MAVEPYGDVVLQSVLAHQHRQPHGPHEGGLHGVVELGVGHPDVPRHVPRQVDHRDDRLVPLALVPLVPGEGRWRKLEIRNEDGNSKE